MDDRGRLRTTLHPKNPDFRAIKITFRQRIARIHPNYRKNYPKHHQKDFASTLDYWTARKTGYVCALVVHYLREGSVLLRLDR